MVTYRPDDNMSKGAEVRYSCLRYLGASAEAEKADSAIARSIWDRYIAALRNNGLRRR